MHISTENRQLIKIAAALNGLFILLFLLFFLYAGHPKGEDSELSGHVLKFTMGSGICWIINLALALSMPLLAPRWKQARWILFYLPSYLITCGLGIVITQSHFYYRLTGDLVHHPVTGPISFVLSINTLSLLAIELIRSYYAQANIRVEHAQMQAELSRLRALSIEAQHEKLKNQLHPHFLFNSLTALKSLIRKEPSLAESYLIKLSFFLRFSMNHNEQNTVALQEELKFSLYYLEMQKIRFRDALSYEIDIPEEVLPDAQLPVFSLQLTIENAIKHNLFTQDQPLHILMQYVKPDWLLIRNNIQGKVTTDASSGIGLKNLSDRYKLLTQQDIVIENNKKQFSVYLKVIRP